MTQFQPFQEMVVKNFLCLPVDSVVRRIVVHSLLLERLWAAKIQAIAVSHNCPPSLPFPYFHFVVEL